MQGDRGGGFRGKAAPVRVGDEMEVEIEAVGKKGDGIAKREGFVLFVPNTRKGDNVRIKITKVLGSVGFAEVLGKKEESNEEQESGEESEEEEGSDEEIEDTEDFGEE
ncbi:TRAM domain-containing protein [Candidatus Woesearchaeota archaeon]|nr:TRAM domain-containing protein [Candidatus Woesearchaeota archaeon]